MKQRATAIAIAAIMVAAGFSIAPSVQAGHNNCHEDFEIADAKSQASDRTLTPGESEIGHEDTSLASGDETLNIRLKDAGTNGELTWTVRENTSSGCVVYTDGGCDEDNVLQSEMKVTCTLRGPSTDTTRDFYVEFAETGSSNEIVYDACSSIAPLSQEKPPPSPRAKTHTRLPSPPHDRNAT